MRYPVDAQLMPRTLEQLVGLRPAIGMSVSCQDQGVVIPQSPAGLLVRKFLAREEKLTFGQHRRSTTNRGRK